jgi:cell surface protein SprA
VIDLRRTGTLRTAFWTLLMLLCAVGLAVAQQVPPAADSTGVPADSLLPRARSGRRPVVNLGDRYPNRLRPLGGNSPLAPQYPRQFRTSVRVDSTQRLIVTEEVLNADGPPVPAGPGQALTLEEYRRIQNRRADRSLLKSYAARSDGQSEVAGRGLFPKINFSDPTLDRIFGGNGIEFQPNGSVLLDFGLLFQNIDNPAIPVRQRRTGNFNFNQQFQVNLNGRIGDKVNLNTNFDTKASFSFENQLRLNYRAEEEDIIQKIEAGNTSMVLNSQLIPGVQNLFGLKTQLRFGRLDATVVAAQQRSKRQSITLRNGTAARGFEIRNDQYDENRHFFLSQYFRNNYERSLASLPVITSGVTITRVEVYVTNRTNSTETLRNLVGLADLGEAAPYNRTSPAILPIVAGSPASNAANGLYATVTQNPAIRPVDNVSNVLEGTYQLARGVDYDLLRGARKLTANEFRFEPQLGYVSLTAPLRNDEVLAVAYEYTLNGRNYKVGELTEDYQNRQVDEVIVLKLLKSATIRNRTDLPLWDLMMKNVYSLNTQNITRQNFQLRVIYKDDLTGVDNPNLQEGRLLRDVPLLRIMNLDRLNPNNDPQPDGNFDFVEGVTIDSRLGRIYFPVLEPFGSNLQRYFAPDETALAEKYVFSTLYRSTLADAQQVADKTKFFIRGSFQGSNGAEVQLPFGVDEKTVQVTAGGVGLSPSGDFLVDAGSGRVRILNEAILNSGREIVVSWEMPDLFNNQIRTLIGTRLDFRVDKDFNIGGTFMSMRESTPANIRRIAVGQEPVNNTIFGLDATLKKDSRWLTRALDALPLIQTRETSNIAFQGEYAQLLPGVTPRVASRAYIDDFEGTRTIYDFARQPTRWKIGATPLAFPQGSATNPLEYGYRRAKISAYSIDNTFFTGVALGATRPTNITEDDQRYHYERAILPQEVFTGRAIQNNINLPINVFDIAYYPSLRGPYNYNPNLLPNGALPNPRQNFGAITRAITADADFENSNIEIVEFWMLDPFISGELGRVREGDGAVGTNNTTGGRLILNLGDISEDIIPDSRFNFENGLPAGPVITQGPERNVDSTAWGRAPRQQFVTNAFDNAARANQDVGLDGLKSVAGSNDEANHFRQSFLNRLPPTLNPDARQQIEADPSADDFRFYFSEEANQRNWKILERYKDFSNLENNSPENTARGAELTEASSNLPDSEDLNIDNTVNELQNYFEYEIDLRPGELRVGNGYIVDRVETVQGAAWYLFRIPIRQPTRQVGSLTNFKSIRFFRVYLTDWAQPAVLRFAQLQLSGYQYRKYERDLRPGGLGEVPEPYDANFQVTTVSVEENGPGSKGAGLIPYVVPPGYARDRDITTLNNAELNEQAMSLCVTDLQDGDSRAVFKNVNLDLQMYRRLTMSVHMNTPSNQDNRVSTFLRVGTDFQQNYYEVEIKGLRATVPGTFTAGDPQPELIWPLENRFDFAIDELRRAKAERNRTGTPNQAPFTIDSEDGRYRITVVGNPDISAVQILMIGVRNPSSDDEQPQSFCVWVNEFHATDFDQTSGRAAVGRADIKLADFATMSLTGAFRTYGFGGVQSRISERSRDNLVEFGVATNVQVDKLLPERWGLRIPFFFSYDRRNVKPEFNPLDPDMPLELSLSTIPGSETRRDFRRMVEENSTRRAFNFSNVRKIKTNPAARNHFYDIENFSATYAFSEALRTSILLDEYRHLQHRGGLVYAYTNTPKSWEPFRNSTTLEKPFWAWLKDFNLALAPTSLTFRADMDRSFIKTQLRNAVPNTTNNPPQLTTDGVPPLFEKYWFFNRLYGATWNLSKSLAVTYAAAAQAIIDEPFGEIDTQSARDSVRQSLLRLGRMRTYDQDLNVVWQIPLNKTTVLDWITANYSHTLKYQFQANSFNIADSSGRLFGNTVQNSRVQSLTGRVDFVALYNRVRAFRLANAPRPPRKNIARSPGDFEEREPEPSQFVRNLTRLVLAVRGINYDYSVRESTILPGFLPYPRYFGNGPQNAPGLPFILGSQNGDVRFRGAAEGWLSDSPQQNQPFIQTINRRFNATTQLVPFKDFQLDVRLTYDRADTYQEFFRPATLGGPFESQSPVRSGNYSISFLSFMTAFERTDRNNFSANFERFREHREVLLERLRIANPAGDAYNLNSQDVLIPSFFAAYSGRDPEKVKFSPFSKFPLPNWTLTYNGLTNLPWFKQRFSSINISHRYTSTYNVGNFVSSLNYDAAFVGLNAPLYPFATQLNAEGQFIPVYVMSVISFVERFAPFIGVQFRTKSGWNGGIEYNQDRNVGLNLSNSSVNEINNKGFRATAGFTKQNLRFRFLGNRIQLKNELRFNCGLTFRDERILIRRLDAETTPTAGNLFFQLNPTIDYNVSSRLNMTVYFDRLVNDPLVSNSFRRALTQGGVRLRFNLAE